MSKEEEKDSVNVKENVKVRGSVNVSVKDKEKLGHDVAAKGQRI